MNEEIGKVRINFLTDLMKKSWYPGFIQLLIFLIFAVILVNLLFGPPVLTANPGTVLTWILWWPLIPLTFFLLGRFWCAICPFGTLGDWVRRLAGLNRPVPDVIKNHGIWMVNGLFFMITWYDVAFGLTKSASATALVFILMLYAVIVFSVIYERRTWCRHICFLGGIFGNYAQTSAVDLGGTPDKCSNCKDLHCFKGREKVEGCNLFLTPKTMKSNRTCNFCGDCFKSCQKDSPGINRRFLPGSELWERSRPRFDEAFLAVSLVALITMSTLGMLEIWPALIDLTAPRQVNVTVVVSLWLVLLVTTVTLIFALGSFISARLAGENFKDNFSRFGYSLIPLNLATHVAHNLNHFLGEGRLIGRAAVAAVMPFSASANIVTAGSQGHGAYALLPEPMVQALQFVTVGLGILLSFNVAGKIASANNGKNKAISISWPHFVVIALFGFISFWLFSLPMSPRH